MTPAKLAKSNTEHAHQVALFAYCAVVRQHGWKIADMWSTSGEIFKTVHNHAVPALEWLHAIPNGGSRGDNAKTRAIRGGQLKAEGVKKGVADIYLPYPVANWHGLYIEMKRPSLKPKPACEYCGDKGFIQGVVCDCRIDPKFKKKKRNPKGGLSKDQIEFKKYCKRFDYGFVTCYSWKEAVKVLKQYIEWSK